MKLYCIYFIIQAFGDYVSGDEKLYFFSGTTGWVRKVDSKPDSVGSWNYTACVLVPSPLLFVNISKFIHISYS